MQFVECSKTIPWSVKNREKRVVECKNREKILRKKTREKTLFFLFCLASAQPTGAARSALFTAGTPGEPKVRDLQSQPALTVHQPQTADLQPHARGAAGQRGRTHRTRPTAVPEARVGRQLGFQQPVAAPGLPHGRQQPRPNRLGRELGAKDALGDGRQPLDQLILGPRPELAVESSAAKLTVGRCLSEYADGSHGISKAAELNQQRLQAQELASLCVRPHLAQTPHARLAGLRLGWLVAGHLLFIARCRKKLVRAKKHHAGHRPAGLPGSSFAGLAAAVWLAVQPLWGKTMPRLLELFSGTGSIGRAFREAGWEVISLDLEPKFRPDILCDVLQWDFRAAFPPGHFDFVWSSPPCVEFSRALTTRPRRLEVGDSTVLRTLEIIAHFDPPMWAIENPQTGLLKSRPFMQRLPFRDVTYCSYGYPYRKQTRLWNNMLWGPSRPVCSRRNRCEAWQEGRRREAAQRGPRLVGTHREQINWKKHSREQLYTIPPALCEEIARAERVSIPV